MPRTGSRKIIQLIDPIIFVANPKGNRASDSDGLPQASENLHLVAFNSLSAAPAVTPLPSPKFSVDLLLVHADSRRKSFH
jgi:hypothetical protein